MKNPTPTGTFNPDLRPVLEVCGGSPAACVRVLTTGDQNTGITMDRALSEYKALWKFSGGSQAFTAGTYRMTVYGANAPGAAPELGHVDVVFDGTKVMYSNGQVISNNGTVPVKFFIARGSLCSTRESDNPNGAPCLEVVVDQDGGTFPVDNGLAGAIFAPNALPPGVDYVTLIIERYEAPTGESAPPNDYLCIPIGDLQYGGCYVFRTIPQVTLIPPTDPNWPYTGYGAVAGVCPEPGALTLAEQRALELWKWDEQDPSTARPLDMFEVEFLDCDSQQGLAMRSGWSQRLLQPLARLLLPSPLHARKISPFGGGLNDFSRVGWVRPLTLTKTAGDAQQGYVGELLLIDPTVRVTSNVKDPAIKGTGVSGITINFSTSVGTATPSSATTDANGYASATWRLGAEGLNTLVVAGPKPTTFPSNSAQNWGVVQFTANGVPLPPPPPPANYSVIFTSPLESGKLAKGDVNVSGVRATVTVCSVATNECWDARRLVDGNVYHYQWKSGSTYPAGNYTFTVREGSTVLGSFVGAVAKAGTKPPRGTDFTFELGSTISVKFYLLAK